jgi:hypothetical protein
MKFFSRFLPPALLITGAILRLATFTASAIWTDEYVTYLRAFVPFRDLWQNHAEQSGDILLESILRPLLHISPTIWMLRLPSVIAGIGSLWLVWLLMKRLDFNPTQRTITSFLVAFAPGLLWMSQDARVYSLFAFVFLLSLYFLLEARWMAFALSLALLCYCHNTAPAFVLGALMAALFLYPQRWETIFRTGCFIAVTYIPQFLLIFQHQQWITLEIAPLPDFTMGWFVMSLIQAFWASTHYSGWTMLLALVVLVLTATLIFTRYRAHGRILPVLLTMIPFLVIFGASLFTNIFVYRVIMPLGFTFFLWLGWELGVKRSVHRWIVMGTWVLLVYVGFARYSPDDMGGHLDALAQEIRFQWRTGDVLVLTTISTGPFDYYLHDKPMLYDAVSDNFFLQPPGLDLLVSRPPDGDPARLWVIAPADRLLDQEAMERIHALVGDADPLAVVHYMQTSSLRVFLVENKSTPAK